MKNYFFTSESVTEGHPDKLCDLISDSILDECLEQDENSKVAIETLVSNGNLVISGQISSKAKIDFEKLALEKIKEIGFDNEKTDLDYRKCKVSVNIVKQSPDIALGVDIGGAGDQGIMFGYACDETPNYMPYAIDLAHKLSKRLTDVRKEKILPFLRPDGKTEVTVEYENDRPKRIDTIIVSAQHIENIKKEELENKISNEVIKKIVDSKMIDSASKILINPTGRFVIGGPLGDTGLTGRKIIVDTYGGYARHGGGAFSGKDPSKVDRSAAYMLRHIAKNIVANGYARKCELQIAYAIGVKEPISLFIETFGTNKIPEEEILKIVKNKFDLTPDGIINYLDLKKTIYTKTTNYGHFGKEDLSWENVIKL